MPDPRGRGDGAVHDDARAGNAGARGGPRGDVLVVFEVADDPRFERDGEDLYTEVLVTYAQLVLGADVQVPYSHDDTSRCACRRERRAGRCSTCTARGLPRVNASGTGDLHVRVQLWTPQSLTDEEETLIRALRNAEGPPPATRARGFWSRMKEALGA